MKKVRQEKSKGKGKYQKPVHIDLPFDEAIEKIIKAPPPPKKKR